MNVIEIIEKKKNNKKLTKKEIFYIVNSYYHEEITDYQMSAFLMAVCINGFSDQETVFFTDAIVKTGKKLKIANLVDKHSTGGVGDKTTLLIAPIVACAGLKMVKMSGGGLGHTGGTVDKLESIKGFRVDLSQTEIEKSLREVGVCLIKQLPDLAPADQKIYQLRDVTGTTNSIPLIASSIMSKKIASGAKILVIDLKIGKGAFVKNKKDGLALAKLLQKIGNHYQIKVTCVLSNMDEPLGYNIGNGLEVKECLEFLKGNYEKKLYDLVLKLSATLIAKSKNMHYQKAEKIVKDIIESGEAYERFKKIIENQGGDINSIKISAKKQTLLSDSSGYISQIDAYKFGNIVKNLGGGRLEIGDEIDYGVGVVFHHKVGDYIEKNDKVLTIYYNKRDMRITEIINSFAISKGSVKQKSTIIDVV